MAHQKLLIGVRTGLFIIISLAFVYPTVAFSLDFTPGKWQITNWIELPDGRQARKESSTECLTETNFLPFGCDEQDCEDVNSQIIGNKVSFAYRIRWDNNSLNVKGIFNYSGNKFEGTMFYVYENNAYDSMKIVMNGELVGDCSE